MVCLHPRTLAYIVWYVFGDVTFLKKNDINRFIDGEIKKVIFGGFETHTYVVGEDTERGGAVFGDSG